MLVLGIDAGASKTECLLADGAGNILEQARGPGANFQIFDLDEIEFVLTGLTHQVLGGRHDRVEALCIGIAGAGRRDDYDGVREILTRIGCAQRYLVTHDAEIALVAGAGERYGVALIVGTGATAFGINRRGQMARAGGWGYLLGDEGSAYWIGVRALQAVMKASDGRAHHTRLAPSVLEWFGVDSAEALVHRVYRRHGREELAALAVLVQRAADRGDLAAQEIVDEAGDELVRAAESVIGGLEIAGESFRLTLAGGLWKAIPVLRQEVSSRLSRIAPWARIQELDVKPAVGAVTLALQAVGASARVEPRASKTPV